MTRPTQHGANHRPRSHGRGRFRVLALSLWDATILDYAYNHPGE